MDAGETRHRAGVFPARAGMFLPTPVDAGMKKGFPRASGDVPAAVSAARSRYTFSPRERGCSPVQAQTNRYNPVFPARAGMFLRFCSAAFTAAGFPRASGDVPELRTEFDAERGFSPRERGCFTDKNYPPIVLGVFPARAGMFRAATLAPAQSVSFPRASGDVP